MRTIIFVHICYLGENDAAFYYGDFFNPCDVYKWIKSVFDIVKQAGELIKQYGESIGIAPYHGRNTQEAVDIIHSELDMAIGLSYGYINGMLKKDNE